MVLFAASTLSSCTVRIGGLPFGFRTTGVSASVSGPNGAASTATEAPNGGAMRIDWEQFQGAPGFFVKYVERDRAADRAGIVAGDCVMALGGVELAPWADVTAAIRSHAVGESVVVRIIRGEAMFDATVVLDEPRPTNYVTPVYPSVVLANDPICKRGR